MYATSKKRGITVREVAGSGRKAYEMCPFIERRF